MAGPEIFKRPLENNNGLGEREKKRVLISAFRNVVGKPLKNIDIDTLNYGVNGNIIKGSGDFKREEEKVVVRWPGDGKSDGFKLGQNIEKRVIGEKDELKIGEPTWKQIIRKIGDTGTYPSEIDLSIQRRWISKDGILEGSSLIGIIPFKDIEDILKEGAAKNSKYSNEEDLLTIGRDLIAQEKNK